jgi:hypothetical protein
MVFIALPLERGGGRMRRTGEKVFGVLAIRSPTRSWTLFSFSSSVGLGRGRPLFSREVAKVHSPTLAQAENSSRCWRRQASFDSSSLALRT